MELPQDATALATLQTCQAVHCVHNALYVDQFTHCQPVYNETTKIQHVTRGGVCQTLLGTLLKEIQRALDTAGLHGSWLPGIFPGFCVIGA
jgi:hypothetical protein